MGGRLVRDRLGAVRPCPHHRDADRRAGAPGGGRGPPHAREPRPDRGELPAPTIGGRRSEPGPGSAAWPPRSGRSWADTCAIGLVAADLPHQPAAGRGGGVGGRPSRARVAQPERGPEAGPGGGGPRRARTRRRHLRAHRGPLRRLDRARHRGPRRGRPDRAGRLRPGGDAQPPSHDPARHLLVAPVHGGQHRDARGLRGPGGSALPAPDPAPGGDGLHPAGGGNGADPVDDRDAAAVGARGAAGAAHRPADPDDRGSARGRRGPRPAGAGGAGRELRDRHPAGDPRVLARPGAGCGPPRRPPCSGRPARRMPAWPRPSTPTWPAWRACSPWP